MFFIGKGLLIRIFKSMDFKSIVNLKIMHFTKMFQILYFYVFQVMLTNLEKGSKILNKSKILKIHMNFRNIDILLLLFMNLK